METTLPFLLPSSRLVHKGAVTHRRIRNGEEKVGMEMMMILEQTAKVSVVAVEETWSPDIVVEPFYDFYKSVECPWRY